MTLSDTNGKKNLISRKDATSVGITSVIAAGSGILVLYLSSKYLSKADNSQFLAFWSLLFGVFGVLGGLQTEATRAGHAGKAAIRQGSASRGTRILPVAVLLGLALAGLTVATSFLWGPQVLGKFWPVLGVITGAGVLMFSVHAGVTGVLGGLEKWGPYSRLISLEALVRLGLVLIVVLVAPSLVGLAGAAALGAGAWMAAICASPQTRRAFSARSDVPTKQLLRQIAHACVATGSSATLVVGFAVLVRVTTSDAIFVGAAPLLMAVTLTRAPLMIPLGTYQSVAVTHFLQRRSEGIRAMFPLARVILAVGLSGGLLAWLVGPWLMATVFGANYRVDGWVLAILTFAAALLALATITGAMCLALHLHGAFSSGWLLGTAISILLLLLPVDLQVRVVLALMGGPIVSIVLHGWAALRVKTTVADIH